MNSEKCFGCISLEPRVRNLATKRLGQSYRHIAFTRPIQCFDMI